MNDEKRNCIFTNLPADAKIVISSSKHNWSKAVPCTKQFLNSKKTPIKLTDIEFKLVELFFQREATLLKIDHIETKMQDLRKMIDIQDHIKIKVQDIEIITQDKDFEEVIEEIKNPTVSDNIIKNILKNNIKEKAKKLTEPEKEDIIIIEKDDSFWE